MNKIDFRKQYKQFYAPKKEPSLIEIPAMQFIMVDGQGNPNDEAGEYTKAIELLYALTYTIKMNCIDYSAPSAYEYNVLPLEGLWWLEDIQDMNFTDKSRYCWTSMIRQPDIVTQEHFERAKQLLARKKPKLDLSKARMETYTEGLCIQCMHTGPFDDEPATLERMEEYCRDISKDIAIGSLTVEGKIKRHHEIYLGDFRKTKPERMKTILRHPIL
jgi:hypothetical protein